MKNSGSEKEFEAPKTEAKELMAQFLQDFEVKMEGEEILEEHVQEKGDHVEEK